MFPLRTDYKSLFQNLFKESDRGCVLLAASHLDLTLAEFHFAHFSILASPSKKLLKAFLTDPDAPLSSFSVKINLAFTLGLISHPTQLDLHAIRKLRNIVAHSLAGFSFDLPEVRAQLLSIKAHSRFKVELPPTWQIPDMMKFTSRHPQNTTEAKEYFLMSATHLALQMKISMLLMCEHQVQQLRLMAAQRTALPPRAALQPTTTPPLNNRVAAG